MYKLLIKGNRCKSLPSSTCLSKQCLSQGDIEDLIANLRQNPLDREANKEARQSEAVVMLGAGVVHYLWLYPYL